MTASGQGGLTNNFGGNFRDNLGGVGGYQQPFSNQMSNIGSQFTGGV